MAMTTRGGKHVSAQHSDRIAELGKLKAAIKKSTILGVGPR